MKWVLVGVVAFSVSSAAAAGFVAMRSPANPQQEAEGTEVPDTSATDSTAATVSEQVVVADTQAVDHAVVHDSTGSIEASEENDPQSEAPQGAAPDCPPVEVVKDEVEQASAPDPEVQRQAYRQVARILSNMRDQEVAQVLAHIGDDEVELHQGAGRDVDGQAVEVDLSTARHRRAERQIDARLEDAVAVVQMEHR